MNTINTCDICNLTFKNLAGYKSHCRSKIHKSRAENLVISENIENTIVDNNLLPSVINNNIENNVSLENIDMERIWLGNSFKYEINGIKQQSNIQLRQQLNKKFIKGFELSMLAEEIYNNGMFDFSKNTYKLYTKWTNGEEFWTTIKSKRKLDGFSTRLLENDNSNG